MKPQTEEETLKARSKDINDYIERRIEDAKAAQAKSLRFMWIQVEIFVAFLVSVFYGNAVTTSVAAGLFWGMWSYDLLFITPKARYILAEIEGMFKVLEMLEMLVRTDDRGSRRRKRRVKWFEAMAAKWNAMKSTARRKAYGMA